MKGRNNAPFRYVPSAYVYRRTLTCSRPHSDRFSKNLLKQSITVRQPEWLAKLEIRNVGA